MGDHLDSPPPRARPAAAGPPDAPDGGPARASGAPTKIHVVDVRRNLLDILTASPEEVRIAVDAAAEALPRLRSVLEALITIAEKARSGIRFLTTPASDGQPPEITARSLFACPAYLPLIDRGATGPPDGALLRVRPVSVIRAIHVDGSAAAVAAEEPFDLLGIVVDPVRIAELVLDVFGGGVNVNRGLVSYAESGSYAPPVLSAVAGARYFPQPKAAPDLRAREPGGPVAARIRETVKALERRGFSVYLTPERGFAAQVAAELLEKARASVSTTWGPPRATRWMPCSRRARGKGRRACSPSSATRPATSPPSRPTSPRPGARRQRPPRRYPSLPKGSSTSSCAFRGRTPWRPRTRTRTFTS